MWALRHAAAQGIKGHALVAALDGAPLAAAMQLSLHRSANQAQRYYADVEIEDNPATELLPEKRTVSAAAI